MSFVNTGLGVGKQVELWDSNVHTVIKLLPLRLQVPERFHN